LIFDEQTAGASSDIDRATRIARSMVVRFGMSKLGPMNFGSQYENEDYNRAWGEADKPSTKIQERVDEEMMNYINEAEKRAMDLLKKYRKNLDVIAENLLEKETLDSDEFAKLMDMPKAKAI